MGVGKEDRERVGSAPILCWTTQLFGSASEQQRGSKAKKKASALGVEYWRQMKLPSRDESASI